MATTKHKKLNKLKRNIKNAPLAYYVVCSLGLLILYTVAELIISIVWGVQNDTLTTCFFAAFGGETLYCAVVKVFKIKEVKDYGETD